jgi:hypothetical protein
MAGESRLTPEQKRTILEQGLKPPVEAPKPPQAAPNLTQLKPVRQEVRDLVSQQERKAAIVVGTTFAGFMDAAGNNSALMGQIRKSSLYTLLG